MIEHDGGTFFELVNIHWDALCMQANRLTQSAPNAE